MKAGKTISGVGLGLGMTAVGFATLGVLSTGPASASTAAHTRPVTTSASPSAMPTAPVTGVPTAPPATGGGGTAGLQDAVLFGIGGAAVLAGSGSIVYRLRGNKQR
jgi:hypothetical protein